MKKETILLRSQYINRPPKFREQPVFFFVDIPIEDKEDWMLEVYDSLDNEYTEEVTLENYKEMKGVMDGTS